MTAIFWIAVAAALGLLTWRFFKSSPSSDRSPRDAREQLRDMAAESVSIHDDLETLKSALAERPSSESFDIELHGEAQRNADGQSRQDIIAQLKEGEYVTLVPEPDNRYDPNAVRVDSGIGTIGYVPRDKAKHVGNLVAHGVLLKTYIQEIRGGEAGYNYGVILHLEAAPRHMAQHRYGRPRGHHSQSPSRIEGMDGRDKPGHDGDQ